MFVTIRTTATDPQPNDAHVHHRREGGDGETYLRLRLSGHVAEQVSGGVRVDPDDAAEYTVPDAELLEVRD